VVRFLWYFEEAADKEEGEGYETEDGNPEVSGLAPSSSVAEEPRKISSVGRFSRSINTD
jgi:hypothetical protein